MIAPRHRAAGACVLACLASACTQWEVISVAPGQYIEEVKPARVRLTDMTGAQFMALEPKLNGESIQFQVETRDCGTRLLSAERGCDRVFSRRRVPLTDVQLLESGRLHPAAKGALIGGAVGGLGTLVVLISDWNSFCTGSGNYGQMCAALVVTGTTAGVLLGMLVGAATGG